MSALEIVLKLIRDSESCKLTAYQCPAGVWTVGWGFTGTDIKKGVCWTQEKADECLLVTAMSVLDRAVKYSPILATANIEKLAAIADFIYNLGVGNYAKSTLKKQVDAGNWLAASSEIKKWDKAGGKVLKGLTIRRNKEADYIEIEKSFKNNYPQTTCKMTDKGLVAFNEYVDNLKEYLSPKKT